VTFLKETFLSIGDTYSIGAAVGEEGETLKVMGQWLLHFAKQDAMLLLRFVFSIPQIL